MPSAGGEDVPLPNHGVAYVQMGAVPGGLLADVGQMLKLLQRFRIEMSTTM